MTLCTFSPCFVFTLSLLLAGCGPWEQSVVSWFNSNLYLPVCLAHLASVNQHCYTYTPITKGCQSCKFLNRLSLKMTPVAHSFMRLAHNVEATDTCIKLCLVKSAVILVNVGKWFASLPWPYWFFKCNFINFFRCHSFFLL